MSIVEILLTVAVIAIGTAFTRFAAFLLFPNGRRVPTYVQYLGKALPPAVFAMLVVYCLKNVQILSGTHGLPELIAITVVVLVHIKWRRMLVSIVSGTVCYMALVQLIFV